MLISEYKIHVFLIRPKDDMYLVNRGLNRCPLAISDYFKVHLKAPFRLDRWACIQHKALTENQCTRQGQRKERMEVIKGL